MKWSISKADRKKSSKKKSINPLENSNLEQVQQKFENFNRRVLRLIANFLIESFDKETTLKPTLIIAEFIEFIELKF